MGETIQYFHGSKLHKSTGKMTQLFRKIIRLNIRWSVLGRVSVFQEFFRFIWDKILVCSIGKPIGYRRLPRRNSSPSIDESGTGHGNNLATMVSGYDSDSDSDSDLVSLKICLVGDCQIGKTSFVIKYVGDEQETTCLETKGLNLTDKTLFVRGARIAFSIWDVGGIIGRVINFRLLAKMQWQFCSCLILLARCTLNSVVEWYSEARRWNQTAIPILVGTKFDNFVQLPPDLQWTIVTQARGYGRAMKASLFFSSATHNINVNKIFKYITAKLFNLPWSLHPNLNPGEPTIDFF